MAKIHSARKFLEELREEFQPLRKRILTHPFVGSVEKGKASVEKLKFFVEQQFHIVNGDFRNLALYIAFSSNQWIIDFEVWGENCSRISKGLKKHYNLTSEDTKFLDGFYPITSQFYDKITNIIGEYTRTEKDMKKMRIATRLGLDYELMFWDTML